MEFEAFFMMKINKSIKKEEEDDGDDNEETYMYCNVGFKLKS